MYLLLPVRLSFLVVLAYVLFDASLPRPLMICMIQWPANWSAIWSTSNVELCLTFYLFSVLSCIIWYPFAGKWLGSEQFYSSSITVVLGSTLILKMLHVACTFLFLRHQILSDLSYVLSDYSPPSYSVLSYIMQSDVRALWKCTAHVLPHPGWCGHVKWHIVCT